MSIYLSLITTTFKYLNKCPKFTKASEFVKTCSLPKAHSDLFPFLYCLSVPMSHK